MAPIDQAAAAAFPILFALIAAVRALLLLSYHSRIIARLLGAPRGWQLWVPPFSKSVVLQAAHKHRRLIAGAPHEPCDHQCCGCNGDDAHGLSARRPAAAEVLPHLRSTPLLIETLPFSVHVVTPPASVCL